MDLAKREYASNKGCDGVEKIRADEVQDQRLIYPTGKHDHRGGPRNREHVHSSPITAKVQPARQKNEIEVGGGGGRVLTNIQTVD